MQGSLLTLQVGLALVLEAMAVQGEGLMCGELGAECCLRRFQGSALSPWVSTWQAEKP